MGLGWFLDLKNEFITVNGAHKIHDFFFLPPIHLCFAEEKQVFGESFEKMKMKTNLEVVFESR